jgi:hypothetical protein
MWVGGVWVPETRIGLISVIQLGRSVRLRAVSIGKRTARSTATWYPRAALLRM